MKKLILIVLLFSAQFAWADFAADLASAAVGADVSALVQTAITNGESAASIAAALQNAGISDEAAVTMLSQVSYPEGTTAPDVNATLNTVIAAYGLTGDAATTLGSRAAGLPARTGTGSTSTPVSFTITSTGSGSGGAGGGGGGGGGVTVSAS